MSTPLRQQLNTILADMRTQQARIQAASERLGNATASATSKDRAIEAVVDNRGRVTALKLKGTGYRKLPPAELADYLNRFAAIGVDEILVSPIGGDSLDKFLDRFDAEVRPQLK